MCAGNNRIMRVDMARTQKLLAASVTTGAVLCGVFALATLGGEKQEEPADMQYGLSVFEEMPDGTKVLRAEITPEDNAKVLAALAAMRGRPLSDDLKPSEPCGAFMRDLSSRFDRVSAECRQGDGGLDAKCANTILGQPIPNHVKQACKG